MARGRSELQALLEALLGSDNVYFQPPTNTIMQYPCIVFKRDRESVQHADNRRYRHTKGYQVTIITKDVDSDIPEKVAELPLCSFDRFFTAENLNHDVYILFF